MKLKIQFLILVLFSMFFSAISQGAIAEKIFIKGTLKSYDKDFVVLIPLGNGNPKPFKVRRSNVGSLQGILVGATLTVQTSIYDFIKLNGSL